VEVRGRHPQHPRTIVSAQALRLLLDLALTPLRPTWFGTALPIEQATVRTAMTRIAAWNQHLTARALDGLAAIDGSLSMARATRRGGPHWCPSISTVAIP